MSVAPGDLVEDGEKRLSASSGPDRNSKHVDDGRDARPSAPPRRRTPGFNEIAGGAIAGVRSEKRMTIRQGLRTYPKAIGWSVALSTAIVMEGYDVTLLPNLFAFDPFNKKFGVLNPATGTYEVSAAWQAGLTNGANVGEIIGLFFCGIIADKIGYRKTMAGALVAVTGFIFIPFFAQNVETLLVGEILCGIPWGVFQTLTTAYAAEVMPVPLRCYLTTYVNCCWVIGQLIATGVMDGLQHATGTEWSYRVPFAIQWAWPIPLIAVCTLAPESPWWLIRQARIPEAKHHLLRLTSPFRNMYFNLEHTISMMIHTNDVEKDISSGTSYSDCFKGTDLRRTEITCMTWAIQNLCGSAFMNYSTYLYVQAGLSPGMAINMSVSQYALGLIGTILSWFLMARAGRRTIYVRGLFMLTLWLLAIGILGIFDNNSTMSWVTGSMLLGYTHLQISPPSALPVTPSSRR